jgi:hypothetical protein
MSPVRLVFSAAILACLGMTGCASCDLKGGNFADNSTADQVSRFRKPDPDGELSGVSTKSQQVEKDLGL